MRHPVTKIVGILNLTPDSFSDGGKYVADMSARVRAMVEDGADVIDVGAESTRPGATPLAPEEEWARLKPFMETLLPELRGRVQVSCDTRHAETARRALEAGVDWINDVSGFADREMIAAVAGHHCRVVFMHSLTVPADPNVTIPEVPDVIAQLSAFARARMGMLEKSGIDPCRMVFDPGVGFGKTAAQSLAIVQRVEELQALGLPLMIGHSRKSFLTRFTDAPPEGRDAATLAISAELMEKGVAYLRVHDVAGHAGLRHMQEERAVNG